MTFTALWSEEAEQRLLELASTAGSIVEIALALGTTRNAVVGKLNRMRQHGHMIVTNFNGKTGRPRTAAEPRKPRKAAEPKPKLPPRPKPDPGRAGGPPEPWQPREVASFPMRRITLMELEHRDCRWPLGDEPPFLFCGNATDADNRPYCPVHHRAAHQR